MRKALVIVALVLICVIAARFGADAGLRLANVAFGDWGLSR